MDKNIKKFDNLNSLPTEAIKQIGEISKAPISNLLDPTTQVLGERFAALFDLILLPLEIASVYKEHKLELFKSSLIKKANKIPDSKLIAPPLNIVGPALEASKYYIDDEVIREMFAELIASSMNSDKSNEIHPSFVEVIKQMSPHDAKMFKHLLSLKNSTLPMGTINYSEPKTSFLGQTFDYYYEVLFLNFADSGNINEDYLKNANSLASLERLGIIQINNYPTDLISEDFENLQDSVFFKRFSTDYPTKKVENHKQMSTREVRLLHQSATLSLYGKAFSISITSTPQTTLL